MRILHELPGGRIGKACTLRLALLGAILSGALAISATPAAASQGGTAQLLIQGSIVARCDFTNVPGAANLGTLTTGEVQEIGTLSFSCNLPTSSTVHLTIQSAHGALLRDGGTETVAYQAAWNVQGRNDDYGDASAFITGVPFTLDSGAPGSTQGGDYKIKITGPTSSLVAGTYRDTITYTITP